MAQSLLQLTEVQLEAKVPKASWKQSARLKAKMLRIEPDPSVSVLGSFHLCLALWVPSPVQVSLLGLGLGRPVMVV